MCNFTFVVREDKVHAAAMYVEVLAEVFFCPWPYILRASRETVAPWAGPAHDMFGLRTFPEGEVGRVMLFALSVQLAGGVEHIVQIAAGEFAVMVVFIVFGHVEVDGTFTLVGISVLHDFLHECYLLNDMAAGMRLDAGRKDVQRVHCLVVTVDVVLCHLHRFELFQTGFLGYLVFAVVGIMFQMPHIGDIAHVAYFVADMREIAEKQVESYGRTCVSQVRVAIDGRSADVHAHMRGVQGYE